MRITLYIPFRGRLKGVPEWVMTDHYLKATIDSAPNAAHVSAIRSACLIYTGANANRRQVCGELTYTKMRIYSKKE